MTANRVPLRGWECICDLPNCIGKGKSWISLEEKPPKRCSWCKSPRWNGGADGRLKAVRDAKRLKALRDASPVPAQPKPKEKPKPKPKKVRHSDD